MVEAALRAGAAREVFVTDSAAARFSALLSGVDIPIHLVTERAAKALSDTVTPVGLIAVCASAEITLHDALAARPALVVVAVDLSEPGNAGTLIRLSHAMGAGAVVLSGHSVDPYNAKCLRASAGSAFAVPVVVDSDAAGTIAALAQAGMRILAATPDGEIALGDADLAQPTAWLFGSEAHGLAADVAALADDRVRIPMPGGTESLNVAASAAICLYESAQAQR